MCGCHLCIPQCTAYNETTQEQLNTKGHRFGDSDWEQYGKWDHGVVPLKADCVLDNHENVAFATALKHIEYCTGIRFVRYNSEMHDNWIIHSDAVACANSFVGKAQRPGWQRVNLDLDW